MIMMVMVMLWFMMIVMMTMMIGSNMRPDPAAMAGWGLDGSVVRNICVSDFMMVVMYSDGKMLQWRLQVGPWRIFQQPLLAIIDH